MTGTLPPRQQETLDFIKSYISDHVYSPSVLEIADALGVESTYGVRQHLDALEKKGFIKRQPGLARTIVITEGK